MYKRSILVILITVITCVWCYPLSASALSCSAKCPAGMTRVAGTCSLQVSSTDAKEIKCRGSISCKKTDGTGNSVTVPCRGGTDGGDDGDTSHGSSTGASCAPKCPKGCAPIMDSCNEERGTKENQYLCTGKCLCISNEPTGPADPISPGYPFDKKCRGGTCTWQ